MRMSEEDWDTVLDTNLKGTFLVTRAAIKPMIKARHGKIVNITSVMGLIANPGQANYSASKAGIIGFTRTVAKEVASRNIQVNAVAPGYIETAMTESIKPEHRDAAIKQIPAGRLGHPDDVARVVTFLCSPLADYVTGQTITVDGGMTI
jgi:3-oxoacyl-[acyl-carrier protein] reductase